MTGRKEAALNRRQEVRRRVYAPSPPPIRPLTDEQKAKAVKDAKRRGVELGEVLK